MANFLKHIKNDIDQRYSLFYEWIVINSFFASVFLVTVMNGWVGVLLSTDIFLIIPTIILVFLVGVMVSGFRIYQVSHELSKIKVNPESSKEWLDYNNALNKNPTARASIDRAFEVKQSSKTYFLNFINSILPILGLLGTTIGIALAVGLIDPTSLSNIEGMLSVVGDFSQFYAFALYTTILGMVTFVWNLWNTTVLKKGLSQLIQLCFMTSRSNDV